MSSEKRHGGGDEEAKTARTVGQLVKYSREVNQSDTVEEVGGYAMEASVNLMDGHPSPTIVEIYQGELDVMQSMSPDAETGDAPPEVASRAYETGQIIIVAGDDVTVTYGEDDALILDPDEVETALDRSGVTIAAPSVYRDEIGEVGAVIAARWSTLETVRQYHVKPLDYLADHVATAINNIRSRDRLERARNDLAKRKEMIEVYDRLLRHDLGNDLQVISGFSDALVSLVDEENEDKQCAEYARKINRTARNAADLVSRVGDLVKTLEEEDEPEPRNLQPIVSDVVENVDGKFDHLSVEFDPDAFEFRVYAGDLLDSIFTNILSNAAVHNGDSVTVRVSAEKRGPDSVVIGFADDGNGVAPQVRDEIFEMGKKGPDSDGTGMGLGLARALTESYGGGIDLCESEHGGAEFRITLERA
jgi:signal transduction histidine kinase